MPKKESKNNHYAIEYINNLSHHVVTILKDKYGIKSNDTFMLYDILHYKFYDPRVPTARNSKACFKLAPEDIKEGIALLSTRNNDTTEEDWYRNTLERIFGERYKPIVLTDDLDIDNITAEDIEVVLNPKWDVVMEALKNKNSKYNITDNEYIISRTKRLMEKFNLLSKDHFYIGKITDNNEYNWLCTHEEYDSKIGLIVAKKEVFFIQNDCLNSYSENSKKDIVTYLKYINGVLDYIERNENSIIFKRISLLESNIMSAVAQYYKNEKEFKVLKTGLDKSIDDIDLLKDYIYKTVNPKYLMNTILRSFNLDREESFLLQYKLNGTKTYLSLESIIRNELKPVIFKFNYDYILEIDTKEEFKNIEIIDKSKFDIFYFMIIGVIKPVKFDTGIISILDPAEMYNIKQFLIKLEEFFGRKG